MGEDPSAQSMVHNLFSSYRTAAYLKAIIILYLNCVIYAVDILSFSVLIHN